MRLAGTSGQLGREYGANRMELYHAFSRDLRVCCLVSFDLDLAGTLTLKRLGGADVDDSPEHRTITFGMVRG